jgi:regulator of sigma E protease
MKRLAVSLGGPLANFIFAIAVFAVLGMAFGIPQSKEITVASVAPNSAAAVAGFQPGDVIVEAGGRAVTVGSDVNRATELSAGEAVTYRVLRDGAPINLTATPLETEETNAVLQMKQKVGRIGIALTQRDTEMRYQNPVEAVGYGFTSTGDWEPRSTFSDVSSPEGGAGHQPGRSGSSRWLTRSQTSTCSRRTSISGRRFGS